MVAQIQNFANPIPAGTAIATPVTLQMQVGLFVVRWIEIDVPDGPSGAVGFYLASSGVQAIPFRAGNAPNWLVLNDVTKHWDLENQPTSGDWQFVGYNTGAYPHTVYVQFGLDLTSAPAPVVSPLLPAAVLSSGP